MKVRLSCGCTAFVPLAQQDRATASTGQGFELKARPAKGLAQMVSASGCGPEGWVRPISHHNKKNNPLFKRVVFLSFGKNHVNISFHSYRFVAS